jgi:hypothetical protein
LARRAAAAWDAYDSHRKSPRTCKAGSEFADARRHRGCATLLRGTVSQHATEREMSALAGTVVSRADEFTSLTQASNQWTSVGTADSQ